MTEGIALEDFLQTGELPDEVTTIRPVFVQEMPLDQVRGASYNPRYLSDEAFGRLQTSLRRFGFVKPIIVNGSGVIVAGHQRTKAARAIGMQHVPALQLNVNVHTHDEITFNLMHNSIEETSANVVCPPAAGRTGWVWVEPSDVTVVDVGEQVVRVAAAYRLLALYGEWGSCVAHPATGRVVLNADYAVACTQLRLPLLVYYPSPKDAGPLVDALSGEYGVYDASQVADTPYVQNVVQPSRLRSNAGGVSAYKSVTYQQLSLPRISKRTRAVDFGAGNADYAKRLIKQGYQVDYYEPFTMDRGKTGGFDVRASVRQQLQVAQRVQKEGLYEVVTLDSVLNAASSDAYHDAILRTVAALVAPGGEVCIGTRALEHEQDKFKTKKVEGATGGPSLSFLAPNGRGISTMRGVIYTMMFHSKATLIEALESYFGHVEYVRQESATHLAVCRDPHPQRPDELEAALRAEFNPPYPASYRHNQEELVVKTLMQANLDAGKLLGRDS